MTLNSDDTTIDNLNQTLTRIPGFKVGHAHDLDALTGCTVVLCPENTVGGVDQRGGAPGSRETDLLRPMHLVQHVHAVMLAGGSAFGLAAADGVVRWLEERGIGYPVGVIARVPIVPAAILFDLDVGRADRRPDAAMGFAACQTATNRPVEQGCHGAGVGAKIGGMMGPTFATKGGIGSSAIELESGLIVAALMAVNAFGDVIDTNGKILAGLRDTNNQFIGTLNFIRSMGTPRPDTATASHTVIGVVATNARLNKEQVNKVAQMAHDGLARAVNPAHTLADGDTIFALASGQVEADVNLIGALAAEVTASAIRNAARAAVSLGGIPAAGEIHARR